MYYVSHAMLRWAIQTVVLSKIQHLNFFAKMSNIPVQNVMFLKFDYHKKCEALTKLCFKADIVEYHGKVISDCQILTVSWKIQLYKTLLNSDVEKCVLISAEDFPHRVTL